MIAKDAGRRSAGRAGGVALLLQHSAAAVRERTGPVGCVARAGCQPRPAGRPGAGAGGGAAVSGRQLVGRQKESTAGLRYGMCCTAPGTTVVLRLTTSVD